MMTIAALYVQTDGVYFNLPGVDPWDEKRDARLYSGPFPVIAHPPCHRWINLGCVNYVRWRGSHNRPGNDGGCFAAAINAVFTFKGVLEHPAGSHAWPTFNLTRPSPVGGWTEASLYGQPYHVCEVYQSAYGHKARKATWLLYCGSSPPLELNWCRPQGSHQVGGFDRKKPVLGRTESSATPLAFRNVLIDLANHAIRL